MYFRYHLRKCLVAAFIFAGVIASAEAAEPRFRVDSYIPEKFTDFEWILDGYFNVQGYSQDITSEDVVQNINYTSRITHDEQTLAISADLFCRYETVPWFIRWSVRLAYDIHNANPMTHGSLSQDFPSGIFPEIEIGKYYFGDLFMGGRVKAAWNYSHNLHFVNPDTRRLTYTLDGAAALGWGRIYDGRYAATALYILDELKDNRLTTRPADFNEMQDLTDIVYNYRLKHIIDSRLHKIEALLKIMEYLEKGKIIEPIGPYGYLLIQDVWDYFPNDGRLFGWQATFRFGLEYNHYLRQTTDEHDGQGGVPYHTYTHEETEYQHPYVESSFEYHHPLGVKWQVDVSTALRHYFNKLTLYKEFYRQYEPSINEMYFKLNRRYYENYEYSIEGSIIYILNSRSHLKMKPFFYIEHYRADFRHSGRLAYPINSYDLPNYYHHWSVNLESSFLYRISIPTALEFSLVLNHSDKEFTYGTLHTDPANVIYKNKSFNYYLAASIRHYLF